MEFRKMEAQILLALVAIVALTRGQDFAQQEEKIKKAVLSRTFDTSTLPRDSVAPLKLRFGMALMSIVDLDEKNQVVTFNAWLRYFWNDYRLRWNPNQYGGVNQTRVSPKKIWTPDIMLYNNGDRTYGLTHEPNAVVTSDGDVTWIPSQQLKANCRINLYRFPYDSHTCKLKFGSWTFDGLKLDLAMYENKKSPDMGQFMEHDEWELGEFEGQRNEVRYKCCVEPYPDITYSIKFIRNSAYFAHIFVSPAVILMLLMPFIFLMPLELADKTILGVGIQLCFVLLILVFEFYLPSGLNSTPIVVHFYCAGFTLVSIALVLVTFNGNIWRTRASSTPPGVLAKVFLGTVGKILRVNTVEYRMVGDNEIPGALPMKVVSPPPAESSQDGGENAQAPDASTKMVEEKEQDNAMQWRLIALTLNRLYFIVLFIINIFITIGLLSA